MNNPNKRIVLGKVCSGLGLAVVLLGPLTTCFEGVLTETLRRVFGPEEKCLHAWVTTS